MRWHYEVEGNEGHREFPAHYSDYHVAESVWESHCDDTREYVSGSVVVWCDETPSTMPVPRTEFLVTVEVEHNFNAVRATK